MGRGLIHRTTIYTTDGVCDMEIKMKNLSESPGGICMKFTHVSWQQLVHSDWVARELNEMQQTFA